MRLENKLKEMKEILLDIDNLVKEYNNSINPIQNEETKNKINDKIRKINKISFVPLDYFPHHKTKMEKLIRNIKSYCKMPDSILFDESSIEELMTEIESVLKDIEKSKNVNDNI